MKAKLAFFLACIFSVFSAEEKKDKETLLQLNQELKQRVHDLKQFMEAVQKREQNVKIEHEKLQVLFVKFYLGKKNDEKELSQLKLNFEQRAEEFQKLDDALQKRQQNVAANLNAREKELDAREENFQKREENLKEIATKLHLWEQQLMMREKCIVQNGTHAKLEDLQNREKILNAREKLKIHKQEESLQKRDEDLDEVASSLHVWEQQLNTRVNPNSNSSEESPENSICHFNLYPNESSIQVLHDMETNKIVWVDPKSLVRTEIKKAIELSLQQKGQKRSNGLFDVISNWSNFPSEASPFVKALLNVDLGDVDLEKKSGAYNFTPIMYAARFDCDKAVVKLVERGANTEAVHEYGFAVRFEWTPLHWSAIYGSYNACKALLEKGANVNSQNKNGKTALMFACENGADEVAKLLLQFGADFKIKSKTGMIALYYAVNKCGDVIRAFEREKQI